MEICQPGKFTPPPVGSSLLLFKKYLQYYPKQYEHTTITKSHLVKEMDTDATVF